MAALGNSSGEWKVFSAWLVPLINLLTIPLDEFAVFFPRGFTI